VFDWTVPREWQIDDAYLEHESGHRFAEYRRSNLHVVSYSRPVDQTMALDQLQAHLHSLPAHPDWIPFRSTYYTEDWGFCLSERERRALPAGNYRVVIRSRLFDGAMTLGEHLHAGQTTDEVLLFAHTCHPSLCNDNLSGIVVAAELARYLRGRTTRYTYRIVLTPATIGSIAWMAGRREQLGAIKHGLVLAMLGDAGPLHYHCSREPGHAVNRAAAVVLARHHPDATVVPFSPWGFDERQFNSPGIRLPVGRLNRALTGQYPQEHTSADAMDMMSAEALADAWRTSIRILEVLEHDACYRNLAPYGEPQLGRRGLYRKTGGHYDGVPDRQMALLWLLNQSDGVTSLVDIAEASGLEFGLIAQCAIDLRAAGLLDRTAPSPGA
jgi:aminopeptidase-like protein